MRWFYYVGRVFTIPNFYFCLLDFFYFVFVDRIFVSLLVRLVISFYLFFRLRQPYLRLFHVAFCDFISFFSRLRQPHFRPFHVAFYSCFLYICKRLFPITPRVYFQLFILSAGFEWQKNTTCAWFSCTHCFCTGNFIASIRICWGWFYYCCNPLPYSCFCVLLVLLCSLFFVWFFIYFFIKSHVFFLFFKIT